MLLTYHNFLTFCFVRMAYVCMTQKIIKQKSEKNLKRKRNLDGIFGSNKLTISNKVAHKAKNKKKKLKKKTEASRKGGKTYLFI